MSPKNPKDKPIAKSATEEAIDNERFRSNLLSIVSHELNTPLTGILNSLVMLEEKFPGETDFLPMLRRNAERLRKTVENLLEISRVDAGTLKVRLGELDLGNFVLGRRDPLAAGLAKSRFQLEVEVEEDLPHVCGDIRRLAHVFDSLVLNASKFSNTGLLEKGERGSVHAKVSLQNADELPAGLFVGREKKTGMYLVVRVQSSLPSIGESPSSFEQLFEPFSPWRDADTRVREGLGVELAIAKEILLAHEGFIWADISPAKREGWKFFFALPLLSRIDELDLVVNNRLSTAIGALSKLSLLLLRTQPGSPLPPAEQRAVFRALQGALFRSSDSVFWLQDTGEFVVLMDDCDFSGAERVAQRLRTLLQGEFPGLRLVWAVTTGPDSGASAVELLENARMNWRG